MACELLTKSRKLPCAAPMKGIKAVSFGVYNSTNLIANTPTGVIALPTIYTTPPSVARFEVKATANVFTETGTFDFEASRTNEYVGALTVLIPGNDLALTKTIQTLVGQLWVVFLEDYNGKVHVVGSQNGTDVSSAVYSSDTQGYTLTISTKERELKYELTGAGLVDYAESLLPVL
jgi:hypothetical protein